MDGVPLAPYIQQDAQFFGYEAEIEFLLGSTDGSDWELRLLTDYVRGKSIASEKLASRRSE